MSYWQDYPPTHVLVAAYLMGGKQKTTGKARNFTAGHFNELTQAVSFAGGTLTQKLPQFYKA
jgi:hypothetical protein